MRYFLTGRHPDVSRVLLVESGSRHLIGKILPYLRSTYGEDTDFDLLTCYPADPASLVARYTKVYRVLDYRGKAGRKRLYAELAARHYSVVMIICSDEPIMTKWKWAVAARLPAKVMVLNENGDFFWLDIAHWRTIRHVVCFRAGLSGTNAIPTLARIAMFPFTFLYLALYATVVHLRRKAHR